MDPKFLHATPKMTPHLHLSEAAARLGITGRDPGRKLRRFLLSREVRIGEPILLRFGGTDQVRYRITMALLEQYCPEFFCKREQMMELLSEKLEAIHADLCELRERDDAIADEVARVSDLARAG